MKGREEQKGKEGIAILKIVLVAVIILQDL
jgi:hypothetical protein